MKATIVYYSKKGKTAGYARQISMYLWSKGLDVNLCSISDFKEEYLDNCDFLLLGCWTSGWFVVGQHPHKKWVEFANKLPKGIQSKLLLFSTYKFHTGSIFRKMKKRVDTGNKYSYTTLKSKTGILTDLDKSKLDNYISVK